MLGTQTSFQVGQFVQTARFSLRLLQLRSKYEFIRYNTYIGISTQRKLHNKRLIHSHTKSSNSTSFRLSPTVDRQALKKDIIRSIKPIVDSNRTDSYPIKHQSIVILATPSCITWLESENIKSYLEDLVEDCDNELIYEINVICACVDGLAPSVREIDHGQGKEIHEGISLLWGTSIINSSDLWPSLLPSIAKPHDLSRLIIQHNLGDTEHPLYQVTVPLANTLFRNGRRSTLSASKFQIKSGGVKMIDGPAYRKCVSICTFSDDEKICFKIPAKPLTTLREIEKGFGNIVKRLRIEATRSIPASQELEKAVTNSIELKNPDQCHKIWALIIPAKLRNEKDDSPLHMSCFESQEPISSYIEDSVRRGAKLSRVLSGGGGWGSKEGLLALDPNISHEDSSNTQLEMNPNIFTHEAHVETLGNIAQEGALIQFVQAISDWKLTPPITEKHLINNQIVLGSFDNISKELPKVDVTSHLCIPGLFGCVSESGIFLQSAETGSSKIDIPYSYIYAHCLGKPR